MNKTTGEMEHSAMSELQENNAVGRLNSQKFEAGEEEFQVSSWLSFLSPPKKIFYK